MKVLHFKTFYLNQSETFINRLVRNHKEFEPVISTAFKKEYTEGLNVYEMTKSGWNGMLNKVQLMLNKSPGFLEDVINIEKPSVIHGHFALDSYRLLPVAQKTQIPLIVNFYGYDVMRLPTEFGWKNRYKKLRLKSAHFIAGSADMKRNLISLDFPEDQIEIIKLGLDMDKIIFQPREKAGMNLMMIGRMVEKKGFEYALKAVSILKKENKPVHLDIFGDGPLESSLQELASSLGINGNVSFNGKTNNEEIIRELYEHDILLTPSVQAADGDREGIPQTIVEGMATGIPMIGSQHAGIPELIVDGKTGILVRERDEKGIANAVSTLADNPELVKKVSINARDKVTEEHCIRKMVNKTEALYHRTILNRSAQLIAD